MFCNRQSLNNTYDQITIVYRTIYILQIPKTNWVVCCKNRNAGIIFCKLDGSAILAHNYYIYKVICITTMMGNFIKNIACL